MERHHAAERRLYPEVMDILNQIREEHPTAIIGAVTDGRSNPLLMTFTLGRVFDFSCSWEDDQGSRRKFFQELDQTEGDTSELTWIYDEARYKYAVLKQAKDVMASSANNGDSEVEGAEIPALAYPDTYDNRVWIHVGDDLAFDVGGSAACGAKTIYCELDDDKYGQTARYRYYSDEDDDAGNDDDDEDRQNPSWSTTPSKELKKRYLMAKTAEGKVDVKLKFLSQLPDAINTILSKSS